MTYGLETEWDYSGRKGRDGQKKKIDKANERKEKVKGKRWESKWTRGEEGAPAPHGALAQWVLATVMATAREKWRIAWQ